MTNAWAQALAGLPGPDSAAEARAQTRQSQLTKPAGALGRLEAIPPFLARWQGERGPAAERVQGLVFAGNHGVAARGVSAYPPAVTQQMVAEFGAGGGAINAFAQALGIELSTIPLDLDTPTADFCEAPALSEDDFDAAWETGACAVDAEADLLILGEMGIGNTTAAAALSAALFGGSAAEWVGPGTGVAGEARARKCSVVEAALKRHEGARGQGREILRRLGGRELVAIAGAAMAARRARIPVLLDGFAVTAAVAPLRLAAPAALDHCLAGHVSAEPGHRRLLANLELVPLLDLGLRLGEGTGAALAVGLVRGALAAHRQMRTFEEAGIAGPV